MKHQEEEQSMAGVCIRFPGIDSPPWLLGGIALLNFKFHEKYLKSFYT